MKDKYTQQEYFNFLNNPSASILVLPNAPYEGATATTCFPLVTFIIFVIPVFQLDSSTAETPGRLSKVPIIISLPSKYTDP